MFRKQNHIVLKVKTKAVLPVWKKVNPIFANNMYKVKFINGLKTYYEIGEEDQSLTELLDKKVIE